MLQAEVTAGAKAQRQECMCQVGGTESQEWLESTLLGEEKQMTLER